MFFLGCPFGVTIDFEGLQDESVTLRERDSTQQVRIPVINHKEKKKEKRKKEKRKEGEEGRRMNRKRERVKRELSEILGNMLLVVTYKCKEKVEQEICKVNTY